MGRLYVRNVPDEVMAKLRQRAAAEEVSFSAYVRDLLADRAGQITPAEAAAHLESVADTVH